MTQQPRKATGPAGNAVTARKRARAVRADVLAAQRERERKIEDALTATFERQGAVAELQLQVEAADRDLAAAVAELAGLGEKPEAIAAAMEVPLKEVQRLLKLAEESRAGTPPAAVSERTGNVPAAVAG
jgi:hypothetical protein